MLYSTTITSNHNGVDEYHRRRTRCVAYHSYKWLEQNLRYTWLKLFLHLSLCCALFFFVFVRTRCCFLIHAKNPCGSADSYL